VTARQPANGRRGAHQPADWAALAYRPDPRTPLLRCRCGAAWLDDDEGRHAHRAVFGHQPSPRETTPAQEGPDHAST
jgi:hypothetical protein